MLIYFNIFDRFYSLFSIARRAIKKMDEANTSLLLLLSLFSILLLLLLLLLLSSLLWSRTSRNSFSQATHNVSSENNHEHNRRQV